MGKKEVVREGWILPGNQACYSCSSGTGWKVIGQQQQWVARQAGERTRPVCFTDASGSVRRRDELTSEELLGKGPLRGKWKAGSLQNGQGKGVLHSSPLPTLPQCWAVVKAETTQVQILGLLPLGCETCGNVV